MTPGGPPLVHAQGLRRTWRTFSRRAGLLGALADLGRRAEERVALHGLDLRVDRGERVALLGPNGAGKSTTLKLLCGVVQPSAGSLTVAGLRPWDDRRAHVAHIGAVFGQRSGLWWDLPVRDGLQLQGALHGLDDARLAERMGWLDARLGLAPLLGQPVRELSLGQRVRCELAAALLHEPPLLLLDEPTIGLDALTRTRLRRILRELSDAGVTLLLATHDMADVAAVCDRVVLLDQGRVRFDGSVKDLRHQAVLPRRITVPLAAPAPAGLDLGPNGGVLSDDRRTLRLEARGPVAGPLTAALSALSAAGAEALDVHIEEPDLDAVLAQLYARDAG